MAKVLREYGYDCRRGQQYNGLDGEDVVGLDYIHIECKRVERLDLGSAIYQSRRDSKAEQIPAVFHRKNHSKWLVTMELEEWIKLYNEYYSSMKLVGKSNIRDKIIDLMAETINDHDVDEDICKQMGNDMECKKFTDKEECKKCIKKYFKERVETNERETRTNAKGTK